MSQNLDTLFSGKFYIDQSYGLGLVPSLISIFTGKTSVEKTEADKIKNITKISLNANASAMEVNSTLSDTTKKVVVLDFKQPVVKFSTYNWLGTQSYIAMLETLKNDPAVVGVVVDTDSGGGQVYGTPEFYDAVQSFSRVKTIGIYTNGYLCSGAYYFAAAATFIMANKRADAIGSIGGYTVMVNYDGMMEKYGAKVHTLYSDLSPEKNKGHRGVMDGTDEGGKEYIKTELNPMVTTFHVDMKVGRPQLDPKVFLGGTWSGEEAVALGLVDSNGSLQDAVAEVWSRSKSDNTNSNNNSNLKKGNMSKTTKSFPAIQTLIGIEGEGIATISTVLGNKGVQLTEAQLEVLENALVANEAAVTAANGKVATAEGVVTALGTSIDAVLTTAKVAVAAEATIETKITSLGAEIARLGAIPGAKATKAKAEGDSFEEEDNIVNAADAHNEFYNKA
ncbi:S49 family peptidase [Flavobacterium sp. F-380]|uniref:S49 family peptidase n=1 Tax=Flavobacterium kayseriense TaxID=2764714 RepID=A0ABR7J5G6_9FLAO|nr:S49 family peptidase [Flavobacterium kayseriense]MBC5840766.1 S49 family peptidase [Flavobacterium kayseriense]MBC5846564.1 S49 family peptidase [Flavobacterium kayseriense]